MAFCFGLKSGWVKVKNVGLWLVLCYLVGVIVGLAAFIFLFLLEEVTSYRTSNMFIIFFLPFAGLLSGLLYHYFGGVAQKGNNLLIEEYHVPKGTIPWLMVPLVLFSTLLTHLFGGSAGREGTAVQMGGALSDQIGRWFPVVRKYRRTLLLMGISAGFSSVFGTPLAGTLFALELMIIGRINSKAILPVLVSAVIANWTALYLGARHTVYPLIPVVPFDFLVVFKVILCGIIFGLAAILFIRCTDQVSFFLKKYVSYPPLIPFVGGIVFLIVYSNIGDPQFLGLGVPSIENAFVTPSAGSTFLFKIILTAITLGAIFKGGEVTPLFFIGATLGSFLAIPIGLPVGFLTSLGFVAVFSGATKTPLACSLMGIELFGMENAVFIVLVCAVAYFISGQDTIYKAQLLFSSRKGR